MYKRKTVDAWEFFVNYGQGWESENMELTRAGMKENLEAYRKNCPYPLKIVKRRIPLSSLSEYERSEVTK